MRDKANPDAPTFKCRGVYDWDTGTTQMTNKVAVQTLTQNGVTLSSLAMSGMETGGVIVCWTLTAVGSSGGEKARCSYLTRHPYPPSPPPSPPPPSPPPSPPASSLTSGDPNSYASCKLEFTATVGGTVGTSSFTGVGLSEVRLYDAFGDVIPSAISGASSTGGPSNVNSVFDGSLSTTWYDTSSTTVEGTSTVTLTLTFSSSTAVKAYDLYTGDTQSRDPVAWKFVCTDSAGTNYDKDTRSGITPPTGRKSAYSLTPQTDGNLAGTFAWDTSHPTTTTISPGASVQQCKFLFFGVTGTAAGQAVGLSEVRLYDANGDVLDVISSAENPGGTPGHETVASSKLIDKSLATVWRDTMSVPSTLKLTLSQAIAVTAYDLYTSTDAQSYDPKGWQVHCRAGTSGAWAPVHVKSITASPTVRQTSYVLGANPSGAATYAWASNYPVTNTITPGTSVRQCKFEFSSVTGTAAGQAVGLSEVRLYDANGDVLDVISSAENPGGTPGHETVASSKLIDKSLATVWRDTMSVPSTLKLTLSQAIAVTAYDLYTSTDAQSYDPKGWRAYCRVETSGVWALMHSKSITSSPTVRKTSYVLGANPSGAATYAWASSTSSFPVFASALETQTDSVTGATKPVARSCKFVVLAVSGTGAGEQARGHAPGHPLFVHPLLCLVTSADPPASTLRVTIDSCASGLAFGGRVLRRPGRWCRGQDRVVQHYISKQPGWQLYARIPCPV